MQLQVEMPARRADHSQWLRVNLATTWLLPSVEVRTTDASSVHQLDFGAYAVRGVRFTRPRTADTAELEDTCPQHTSAARREHLPTEICEP